MGFVNHGCIRGEISNNQINYCSTHIMVCTYQMLLSLKENKIQTSNDKNKTYRPATQRLGSVKHEKRDKQKRYVFTILQNKTEVQADRSGT